MKYSQKIKGVSQRHNSAKRGRSQAGNSAKDQAFEAVGTPPAIIDITSSGASDRVSTWGGKRNSANRVSETLSLRDANKLIAAVRYAWAIGHPLNRHITLHWEQCGVPDLDAGAATSRFLRLASQWLKARGEPFAYVWVRENGDGKGSHVHILAHVPSGVSLGSRQRGWLRLITGRPYVSGAILTKRVGGTRSAADTMPDTYLSNLANVVGYQLKGLSATSAEALGLTRTPQHGKIIGKRAGVSENLGSIARSRGGWFD